MVHWDMVKERRRLIGHVFLLLGVTLPVVAFQAPSFTDEAAKWPKLRIERSSRLPFAEASGLALKLHSGERSAKLFVVGDHDPVVATAELSDTKVWTTPVAHDFRPAILERFALCHAEATNPCAKQIKSVTSQWEALAVDGEEAIYLLQETSETLVRLTADMSRVTGVINFNLRDIGVSRNDKKRTKILGSLGEGVILLKNGHVLISKESSPAAIVEFGPKGDQPMGLSRATMLGSTEAFAMPEGRVSYERLHVWMKETEPDCDIGEITAGSRGELFVLSENCRTITRYAGLDPKVDVIKAEAGWRLPKAIKNPEGLAVDGDGRLYLASDTKKSRRQALFLMVAPAL